MSWREPTRSPSPLSPIAFEIMLALADGERHGYAILREVEERTGGAVRLRAGSLYRALGRMLEAGYLEECNGPPDPGDDDPRRRYYRLTPRGRMAARAEAERLATAVAAARAKKVLRDGGSP